MEEHASAILLSAEKWDRPPSSHRIQTSGERNRSPFEAMTAKLLSGFIAESQKLGGTLLDQFWDILGGCHPVLEENIKILRESEYSSPSDSEKVLFEGIDRSLVDFDPVFQLASEIFTHIGVAFMTPAGRKFESGSSSSTPLSVSEFYAEDTDALLRMAASEGLENRRETMLKVLVARRDGYSCPLTGMQFAPPSRKRGCDDITPNLAHIIPSSVSRKPDTIKYLAMFAGTDNCDRVLEQLDDPGNLMSIQTDANNSHDDLRWRIEARQDENQMVRFSSQSLTGNYMLIENNAHSSYDNLFCAIEARQDENQKVEYIYRRIPYEAGKGPILITLCDGDVINFGQGLEIARLGSGPNTLLCNLQLAVARVLRMSGAVKFIYQMREDADDSFLPHVYIASPKFCDILTAQLKLAGGTLV